MSEKELADINYIEDKIDWEGWPDALEWLSGEDFGDQHLNSLIAEATALHGELTRLRAEIEDRVHELTNIDE